MVCGSQHGIGVVAVVEGIICPGRFTHHVAVRSETPPSSADTSCQGGTCREEGFAINSTPLESVHGIVGSIGSFVRLPSFNTSPSLKHDRGASTSAQD